MMNKKSKGKKITQADIANELGVSIVTVSNALNNRNGVSDSLRQRILNTAEELGYQQTKSPYKYNKGERYNIGVAISARYLDISPSFYMMIYQKIVIASMKNNSFALLEVITDESEKNFKLPDLLSNSDIDGILIIGQMNRQYVSIIVEKSTMPLVFVDYYADIMESNFVVTDGYMGGYEITKVLLNSGYKEIAFVGNIYTISSIVDRYLGFRKAMQEFNMPIRDEWIMNDRRLNDNVLDIQLPEIMPEAFVCNCDRVAGLLIKNLQKSGYQIPRDIAVTGYDDYIVEDLGELKLTTYKIDIDELAKVSVNTLLKKIEHDGYLPKFRVVSGRLIKGNSIKTRKGQL